MDLKTLVKETVDNGASDLHLASNEAPMIRVDGELQRLDHPALKSEDIKVMLDGIMTEEQKKELHEHRELDFSFTEPDVASFRVNAYHQRNGLSAALRAIPFKLPTFEQLELPMHVRDFCQFPNGLIIMTGPTGSGKSTTLAAMIKYLNEESGRHQHIITVEDPIEYLFENKNCLINQREVGRDTLAFNNALRSALREDPDIILVGEMRDLETIRLALTAAETGHLVFGTMHTNSAAKSIDRIIDAFPGGEKDMVRAMLAESLRAVVGQKLMLKPEGGMRAAIEIMICTPAIRNLIREHKIPQIYSAIQTGRQYGMQTMEQHIEELLEKGLVLPPKKFQYEDQG